MPSTNAYRKGGGDYNISCKMVWVWGGPWPPAPPLNSPLVVRNKLIRTPVERQTDSSWKAKKLGKTPFYFVNDLILTRNLRFSLLVLLD